MSRSRTPLVVTVSVLLLLGLSLLLNHFGGWHFYGPTFDSSRNVVLNMIALAIEAIAVLMFFARLWRTGKLQWRDLLLLATNSMIAGVSIPVFPLIWIALERADRRRRGKAIRGAVRTTP